MQTIRSFFKFVEYLSIAGLIIMTLLFFTGHLGVLDSKWFLTVFDILLVVFIFLNCTDDYKTPFEKLFRFIGWIVLFAGIFLLFIIHESVKPDTYWAWLNSVLVLGLFAAQLSEINELKRSNDVLKLINFLAALAAFVVLVLTIHGNPVSFPLLFSFLGLNLVTVLATILTGKLK